MNQLIFPIIKHLSDGKFHSGETIAKRFKVSRATVWNAIQEAEALGVSIFSVRGRGYKLAQAVILLDQALIESRLKSANSTISVEVHDHLDSTNTYLMQSISNPLTNKRCVTTNLQTQGRGRRGRTWQAGLGESLTFSLLWRFECGAAGLSGLSLAVGVAIIRALHQLGLVQAKLKWPNDIVVKNHDAGKPSIEKLAGILIELQGDMEGPSAAVIGIGINLTLSDLLKANIDQPATDIASIAAGDVNPNQLLGLIVTELEAILMAFERNGFAALKSEWLAQNAYTDEMVKLIHPDGTETLGLIADIDDDGALLVSSDHETKRFNSGEISLRTAN
jgi:BirA family biotin operon repressor/biotin-[acetyl-CoA-carboxylase] ligase